jgi:Sec-independent protein translocase protein TatA
MKRRIPLEIAYLIFGTLYGLIVGILGNIWASTYTEIILNNRTDLWGWLGFWTLGIIGVGLVLFVYGARFLRRGRDVQHELVSLRNQLEEMKKQIEKKLEEIHETKEEKILSDTSGQA